MKLKHFWWLLPLTVLLAIAGFVIWALAVPSPMPEAMAALQSDARVHVEETPFLVFLPTGAEPAVGLILYPGGRVDPRAYAPAARAIAQAGYLVVIPPMPLNLAVFAPDRAAMVMQAFPQIKRWAVGGHSLGGAMAALFTDRHPEVVQGLVLWASYPAASNDLSGRSLMVVSISGSRDGLSTPDKIEASRSLLPADTRWVVIAGGDHAQFGWYGPQRGDNEAAVSREAQQQQIITATEDLLASLDQER